MKMPHRLLPRATNKNIFSTYIFIVISASFIALRVFPLKPLPLYSLFAVLFFLTVFCHTFFLIFFQSAFILERLLFFLLNFWRPRWKDEFWTLAISKGRVIGKPLRGISVPEVWQISTPASCLWLTLCLTFCAGRWKPGRVVGLLINVSHQWVLPVSQN